MRKNEKSGQTDYLFSKLKLLLIVTFTFMIAVTNVLTITASVSDQSSQQQRITGTVTDGKTGEPLGGVVVQVKGTMTGEITQGDGTYTIPVTPDTEALLFSFIGYQSQEIAISGRSIIDVVMVEEVTALDEVVVIGYGTQKKSLVTGAIASVSSEDIQNSSVTRAEQVLQGKAAGVQVISTSGAPGADMKVRIRGYSSNGNADPLYIVDGIKSSNISFLNPEDISNIEVLKDAASSAIYGAEGGNGVILVTTKTGKTGTGEISYDFQYSDQTVGKLPDMLNSLEYATYFNEAGLFTIDPATITHDTDWINSIFEHGNSARHNLSFTGGTDKSKFLLSLSALNQDGIVVMDKDSYKRYTFRLNAETQVKSWLKVGTSNNYSFTNRKSVREDNESSGTISAGLLMDPLTPITYAEDEVLPAHVQTAINNGKKLVKDANGLYYGISPYISKNPSNPFVGLEMNKTTLKTWVLQGNIFAEIQPVKHVMFTSRLGYEIGNSLSEGWNPVYFYNTYQAFNDNSSIVAQESNTNFWQWENFVSYTNKFNLHSITVLAGASAESRSYQYISASGGTMLAENEEFAQLSLVSSQALSGVGGQKTLDNKASLFARGSYDFNNKYMLQATIRRDGAGSSMLPPENRWGLFPSFSAGWLFTNESFMPTSFLSYGKLRASWGKNGSLSNLSNYMYNSAVNLQYLLYELGDNVLYTAAARNQLENPNLTWETSVQTDIGLDLRMLKDRLTLTMDYFYKKTTDLITPNTPPLEAGNTAAMINGGDILNTGFEFMAEFKSNIGEFNYSVSGNFTTLKNEVTYLNPSIQRILGGQSSGAATFFTAFEKGLPVWYFRGYKTDGINMTTGQANFIDQNEDGLINENDRVFIGSSIPDLTYGANINLSYKGFDFSASLQGQSGGQNMVLWMRNDLPGSNFPKFLYEGRWTPGSTDATRPKAGFNPNTLLSDQMLFESNFVRIKQIQLGYNLPQSVLNIIKLKFVRVYVSLEDYFTFTNYPGMDPEAGSTTNSQLGLDKGMYPITKKAIFGLSITL
ncbi:MAG: TonB-dependent receptor [Bacteroidales bacterium]|jgi:TonB-linked SusC/RagA family outer membrane protein|nr:TonB-dependent receptor [Bacteroidales bacterium]